MCVSTVFQVTSAFQTWKTIFYKQTKVEGKFWKGEGGVDIEIKGLLNVFQEAT